MQKLNICATNLQKWFSVNKKSIRVPHFAAMFVTEDMS